MGTSASFGGTPNGASLIPAFLNDDENDVITPEEPVRPDDPAPADDDQDVPRFESARRDFTRWVSEGGEVPTRVVMRGGALSPNSRGYALGRSLGRYTRNALQGSRNATTRMSRASTAALGTIAVLRDIQGRGLNTVLRDLNLGELVGHSTREIFAAIIDVVCSRVENIDDDLARQALFDSLLVLNEEQMADLAELNEAQIANFYAHFICKAIERRYLVDVSDRARGSAHSDADSAVIDENVGRFIEIAVHTRVAQAIADQRPLDAAFTEQTMSRVFEAAWQIMESFASAD